MRDYLNQMSQKGSCRLHISRLFLNSNVLFYFQNMHLVNVSNFGLIVLVVKNLSPNVLFVSVELFTSLIVKIYVVGVMFCQFFCDTSSHFAFWNSCFCIMLRSQRDSFNIESNERKVPTSLDLDNNGDKGHMLSQVSAKYKRKLKVKNYTYWWLVELPMWSSDSFCGWSWKVAVYQRCWSMCRCTHVKLLCKVNTAVVVGTEQWTTLWPGTGGNNLHQCVAFANLMFSKSSSMAKPIACPKNENLLHANE